MCQFFKDALKRRCSSLHQITGVSWDAAGSQGIDSQQEVRGLALSGMLEQESQPAPRGSDIMLYFWLSSGAFRSLKGVHYWGPAAWLKKQRKKETPVCTRRPDKRKQSAAAKNLQKLSYCLEYFFQLLVSQLMSAAVLRLNNHVLTRR